MPASLLALLFVLGLPLWAWIRPPRAGFPLFLAILCAATIPFLLPQDPRFLRIISSGYAAIYAVKLWERSHLRILDPTLWRALPHFLLWWWIPPDITSPENSAQSRLHRRQGRTRILRGLLKLVTSILISLLVAGINFPIRELEESICATPSCSADALSMTVFTCFFWSLSSLLSLYFLLSGAVDLVSGAAMQSGFFVRENFRNPVFASSPANFWSKRWNLFVTGFAYQNIFLPCGGVRHPAAITMWIFFISGLLHEYLWIACLGDWSPYTGLTMAFFLLHGLAVILQGSLARRSHRITHHSLSVTLHMLWMVATGPAFLIPLNHATGFSALMIELSSLLY